MFDQVSVFGTRAAVWQSARAERVPAVLVLPGAGSTVRERALRADPASAPHRRRSKPGASHPDASARRRLTTSSLKSVSAARSSVRLVLPGEASAEEIAASRLGVRVPKLEPLDDFARARLIDDSADLAYARAAMELGCWRQRLSRTPPGPDLAAILEERPETLAPGRGKGDPFRDDGRWADAVLATVQARARLIAHLKARQFADLAEISAHYPAAHEFLGTEIALALSTTESASQGMLGVAEALRDRLPLTLQALSDGRIDEAKVCAIVAATTPCAAEVARMVEVKVLPGAERVTATTVRRRAERAVIASDPEGSERRHERAARDRSVWRWTEPDGMARLSVYSTAQDVATIHEALTALAHASREPSDPRDAGARRVDALVEICSDILDGGGWKRLSLSTTSAKRNRPHIRITMPLTALLGADDPCELDGDGPITSEQARKIAADGVLQRLVCDPLTGTLLDLGRTLYEPPTTLKDFVRARDGRCVMPTCATPAARADIDHIVPARPDPRTGLPTLGTTSADNLATECRHHHLGKDGGGGFQLARDPDDGYTWTTPLGRSYRHDPERLWHPRDRGSRRSPSPTSSERAGPAGENRTVRSVGQSNGTSAPENSDHAIGDGRCDGIVDDRAENDPPPY
jgi:hypothetical protein